MCRDVKFFPTGKSGLPYTLSEPKAGRVPVLATGQNLILRVWALLKVVGTLRRHRCLDSRVTEPEGLHCPYSLQLLFKASQFYSPLTASLHFYQVLRKLFYILNN